MKVYFEKNNKTRKIEFKGDVSSLLKKLKINPETVLVIKNSELVSEDEKLKNSDSVKILSVVSGG